jgi:hypothetical protein
MDIVTAFSFRVEAREGRPAELESGDTSEKNHKQRMKLPPESLGSKGRPDFNL